MSASTAQRLVWAASSWLCVFCAQHSHPWCSPDLLSSEPLLLALLCSSSSVGSFQSQNYLPALFSLPRMCFIFVPAFLFAWRVLSVIIQCTFSMTPFFIILSKTTLRPIPLPDLFLSWVLFNNITYCVFYLINFRMKPSLR